MRAWSLSCYVDDMKLSSSDDDQLTDLDQTVPMTQQIGSFNFPPLNPQNQFRWHDNQEAAPANPEDLAANPANSAADPANPVNRKTLRKTAASCVKPGAIMFNPVTAAEVANASDTPKEVVTLKVEDMPVIVEGKGYICTTCYEIIPEPKYISDVP